MEELEKLLEACIVCSRHSTATQRPGELRVRDFVETRGRAMVIPSKMSFSNSTSFARGEIILWREQK